ncbi:MAG: fructosamine kinase family protein [Acidimicrobiales bacterium]
MFDSTRFTERVAITLEATVLETARLGGGDVAESFRMRLDDGRTVFAKTHRDPPPEFFQTEAAGLTWLRESGAIAVPDVLAVADGLLVLEWITEGAPVAATEANLGRALARLHRSGAPCFGRADRRTTGSRRLPNDPCPTWVEFYATQRLLPLARLAGDATALPPSAIKRLEAAADRLAELGGDVEPPARLHGDLWAGNRLIDASGTSWLIDPAAHGGHREFDLAMMRLFGGFGPDCHAAYAQEHPLSDGWEARVPLHQLAPLVVHAIKFGGGYVAGVDQALSAID